jgi:hypothetical protein
MAVSAAIKDFRWLQLSADPIWRYVAAIRHEA